VKLYKTTALLATTASALALAIGTGPASAAVTPALSGHHAVTAVAGADGTSAVVTVRVVCPPTETGFAALQVTLGSLSNTDGARAWPGAGFQCTGKTQKVAVFVELPLAMRDAPNVAVSPGSVQPARVSLTTHTPESQNYSSKVDFDVRNVTVKG
jgi:hypothetical protein